MFDSLSYQMRWAWSISKGYRGGLATYFILELLAIILSLSFVLWSKRAVDFAIAGNRIALEEALLITAVFLLTGMIARTYSRWLNEKTRMRMMLQLQNEVIRTQMTATWQLAKQWHSGDIQVRVNADCNEIVQMVGYSFLSFVLTAIRLMASFAFLWMMDPMLALLILAISPLFLFSKIYFRKLKKLNASLKQSESFFGNVLQENLRFRQSIRVLGVHRLRWKKVEDSQQDIFGLKQRLLNFSTLSQGMVNFTMNAGFLITFVWGVYRLYTGEISFGTMTAFLQLISRIQTPMLGMMAFLPLFIRFRTSVERVSELMAVDVEDDVVDEYIANPNAIALKNISFKYEDSFVFENLSAVFKAGCPTAVVGYSGRGKTTLIRLLLALIEPNDGKICLQTQAGFRELGKEHRVNIAYVPQGDKLFSGTIRENLMLGNDTFATEETIRETLYVACAEFVYDLPDGLNTRIGESGYGLSEGQAQRIAVARALMRNCSIWLFDEVTSALDRETGELLMGRLLEAGKEKILVFVTHDKALANRCKRTIYI